ncbi:MAG: crtD, partial [Myxococcaceae bacterium]|nr:crtD [Myxococcaceae bacterium]
PDYRVEFDALFRGQVPAEPTLYVCHPVASDPTMAPAGHSGVFLMVNAPALAGGLGPEAEQEWIERASRLRAFCLAGLRQLCPEVAGASVRVLGERTPVDLARRGAPGGSIYGFVPHGRLGPFRRPKMRGQVPGLFFSGGGTHPGGGVPLVMLSGHFAAQLAANHLDLRA